MRPAAMLPTDKSRATSQPLMIDEIPFGSALYEASKEFRFSILRHPLGLEWSAADLADEHTQIHIAALGQKNAILGTVVLKPVTNNLVKLRQMAVAPAVQRTGLGGNLVHFAEQTALKRGFRTIEMHARVSARGFYEKLGYTIRDKEFIKATLPTILMVRDLT
jgi:N-acetylglutamate synthase-like GNAT family acetyltransferase